MTLQKCFVFSVLLIGCLVSRITADRKVVCYLVAWAAPRNEPGKFTVEMADTDHCTHIIYAFMGLTFDTGEIKSIDDYIDLPMDGAGRDQLAKLKLLKLKNPNLKIMLSIGGYNEKGKKFSDIARDEELRSHFAKNAVNFLKEYELDGIDICWQFPGQRGGKPYDKENSVLLFKELQEAFKPEGFLLSVHILGKRYIMDEYDLEKVTQHVDFINLACVEYSGPWERTTGVMAPLKSKDQNNVEFAVDYAIKMMEGPNKVNVRHKLILGLPLYGHAYVANKPLKKDALLGQFSYETFEGPWTREGGIIALFETCNELKNVRGWQEVWDNESQTPLAFRSRKFLSYDNEKSLLLKAQLVNSRSLGGVMFWSMDMDDFNGWCFGKKFPMITAVSEYLKREPQPLSNQISTDGGQEEKIKASTEQTITTTVADESVNKGAVTTPTAENNEDFTTPVAENNEESKQSNRISRSAGQGRKMVVCYVSAESHSRPGYGKFQVADIDDQYCTHIIYAFMLLDETTNTIKLPHNSYEQQLHSLKSWKSDKDQKVLVSVGGWKQGSAPFSNMAASQERRTTFINSVIEFLRNYKLDGIDLSWQIPTQRTGRPEDKENSLFLIKEMKSKLSENDFMLTLNLVGSTSAVNSYDIKAVSDFVDFINFAAYEYHGPSESTVSPTSPLTSSDQHNVKYNLDFLLKKGVPANKILLGLPTFGHSYVLAEPPRGKYIGVYYDHGLTSPWTNEEGFIAYNELCYEMSRNDEWREIWEELSQTPLAYHDRQLVSYDNARSLKAKANLVLQKRLAGVMVWSIDMDDFRGLCLGGKYPLLSVITDHINRGVTYGKQRNLLSNTNK